MSYLEQGQSSWSLLLRNISVLVLFMFIICLGGGVLESGPRVDFLRLLNSDFLDKKSDYLYFLYLFLLDSKFNISFGDIIGG